MSNNEVASSIHLNLVYDNKSLDLQDGKTKVVDKVWGQEHILDTKAENYRVKIMVLDPKTECSMHFHSYKEETFILIDGSLVIETIDLGSGENSLLVLGDKYSSVTITPMVPHKFYCPNGQTTPTIFIEASSVDDNDNFRLSGSKRKDADNRRPNS